MKDNKNVKTVVFRINSSSGNAFASDKIRYAVKASHETKPVAISMGDYAASGIYYIASCTNRIIAEQTTLTDSIGVFGIISNGTQLGKK